jgi:hypothetical protein
MNDLGVGMHLKGCSLRKNVLNNKMIDYSFNFFNVNLKNIKVKMECKFKSITKLEEFKSITKLEE